MKKKKFIILLITISLTFFLLNKINFKQDFVWNIKNIFNPKIVFQLKKLYIYYFHDIRNIINLKKNTDDIIISSTYRKFKLTTYSNKIFKKNGPKVFIETHNENLISITGTGILGFVKISDFSKNNAKLILIRNNLRTLLKTEKIVSNPGIILNMKIHEDKIYISYVNEVTKDCYNTTVLKGDFNYKRIEFKKIFIPDLCIEKNNEYGEFHILESGGALEILDDEKIFLSTGTFRYRDLSQDKDSIFGKILLINQKNKSQSVISMGLRNVQGIFYDKINKKLFSTDHGPQGGDEINIDMHPSDNKIVNFGWPISSYGEHYDGRTEENFVKYKKAPLYKSHKAYGFVEPYKYFVSSIAPSNIIFVPNSFDKSYKNQIYISSLGFNNDLGRRSIHTFYYSNAEDNLTNHEIIKLNDRVRDIEFSDKLNSIFLFLEKTASFGVLEKF